jgi:hypothetical protein
MQVSRTLPWLFLFCFGYADAAASILGISGSSVKNLKELFSSATFYVNNSMSVSSSTLPTTAITGQTSELSRVTGRGIRIEVDAFEIGSSGGTLRLKKAAKQQGEGGDTVVFERGKAKWAVALEPETAVFALKYSEDFRRDMGVVDATAPALRLYASDASGSDEQTQGQGQAQGQRQFNLQVGGFGEFADIRFAASTAALSSHICVCTAQRLAAQLQTQGQILTQSSQKHLTAKCSDDMAQAPPSTLRQELEQMSKGAHTLFYYKNLHYYRLFSISSALLSAFKACSAST